MSLVTEREKRSNAGSRMRALLDQEAEIEELFELGESEEDEEFDLKYAEEEDKVDSDFDLDSSEGEQEHIQEGEALDKQLAVEERKTQRTAIQTSHAILRKPVENTDDRIKRRRRKRTEEEEVNVRHSNRTKTILNRILVEDQIREHKKRRELLPKRERPVVHKLTQEELLAEAAITEERNKDSLLEWQQREEARRENAKMKEKKEIIGPHIKYHSFADGSLEHRPKKRKLVLISSNEEGNNLSEFIADEEILKWHLKKDIRDSDLMGRNLVTFVEEAKEYDVDQEPSDTVDLIDSLSEWLHKRPKPTKPFLCPITGDTAKYVDPATHIPYANKEAYKIIRLCLSHQMNWSSSLGLYLGNIPSASGVPKGWNLK
ncbi:YL1 nuclear protein-domain-containing protein [Pilobolus umbonatus]|nr:YL1 nuclear protein-domain-containing protein [Pilobolus umbonatus]